MEAILSYDSDTSENSGKSDDDNNAAADLFAHLKPVDTSKSVSSTIALNSTPVVIPTVNMNFVYFGKMWMDNEFYKKTCKERFIRHFNNFHVNLISWTKYICLIILTCPIFWIKYGI